MATKTITLAGAELAVTGLDGSNAAVRNDSADVLYVGIKPGITPGADGVMSVPAGQSAVVYGISGTIYALGTGQAVIVSSDYNDNPFKTAAQGGSGADDVARAAISAHSGNADIHVTADEKAAWNAVGNRNLLINPDFRINQRGASGTITIAGYFVDRWKLDSGEVTVNADGTLTLNGTISQTLENAVGVSVVASSGAGTASYDDSTRTFTLTASGEAISWAKLEVGTNATPFVPPNAADELAKCQRYFNSLFVGSGIPVQFVGSGIAVSDNMATILVNLPIEMRSSTPTVSLVGTLYLSDGSHTAANSIAVQGIAGSYLNRNVLQLNLSSGATLDRTAAYLLSRRDTDTTLTVSAEL